MKLKELGDYYIGLTYKPESVSDDGTIVLRSGNIQNGKFDLNDIVRVKANIREKQYVKPGDILMCSRNGSANLVGKSTIIPNISEPMTFGAFMTIFRTPYNRYLSLFLKSKSFRRQLASSKTTTINQITINMLDNIEIDLPEMAVQEERCYKLEALQKVIDSRYEQLKKLDDLVKARFVEMFGDPVVNQFGWAQTSLRDVAQGKLSYGSGASAIDFDGSIRYVRITDINETGELDSDSKSPDKYDDKYLLHDGDILFARSGATVGKTFRYNQEKHGKCIYAGYLIRLVPDISKVLPDYVYWYTKTSYYSSFVEKVQRAVAQPNINAQEYGSLTICVPPLDVQERFVGFIKQVDKSKSVIQKSLEETQLLIDSLMQEYFG